MVDLIKTAKTGGRYLGAGATGILDLLLIILRWASLVVLLFILLFVVVTFVACGFPVGVDKLECGASAATNMLQFGGIVLTWTTSFFDLTLQRGVINAGFWLHADGAFGSGIAVVWAIVRDFVNLVLIGGLIWASISMILRTGQQIGKMVVQILIAALLVNFSFLFAGAILDASHFASRQIYTEAFNIQITGVGEENQEGLAITDRFMVATHLGSLYDLGALDKDFLSDAGDYGIFIMVGFIGLLLFLSAAWIFLSIGAIFTQRFVVIIILLMTAPIGILKFTDIPTGKDLGDAWWKALYSQAIFPPVLLLLLAASFKVLEEASARIVSDNTTFLGLFSGPSGAEQVVGATATSPWGASWELVTVYLIGMGLMFASVRISVNIAKQEPLKVPTTGQFYGAYRNVSKGAFKTVSGAGKALSNAPNFLGIRDSKGRLYQNIGDMAGFGPTRRARTGPSAEAQASSAIIGESINEFNGLLDVAAAEGKKTEGLKKERDAIKDKDSDVYKKKDAAYQEQKKVEDGAIYDAAIGYNRLGDVKGAVDAQEHDLDSGKALQKIRMEAPHVGPGSVRPGGPAPQGDAASSVQTTSRVDAKIASLAQTVRDADSRESVRDNRELTQALRLAVRDKKEAEAVVGELRRIGVSLAKLPTQILTQPHVADQLTREDLDEVHNNRSVPYEDYQKVVKAAPKEARMAHNSSPGKYARPRAQSEEEVEEEQDTQNGDQKPLI